jgi:hypothetical protein
MDSTRQVPARTAVLYHSKMLTVLQTTYSAGTVPATVPGTRQNASCGNERRIEYSECVPTTLYQVQ